VLLDFDAELKSQGYNPGSLADLMVAAAFLSEITGIERT
jgi:triphosphoribosyl-dephospho-CoA synthetase